MFTSVSVAALRVNAEVNEGCYLVEKMRACWKACEVYLSLNMYENVHNPTCKKLHLY